MMWGEGWDWVALVHLVWWVLLILAIVTMLRWSVRSEGAPGLEAQQDRALAILRERYARGDIDKAEFEARKRDLAR